MAHEDIAYAKGGSATDITYSLKGMSFPAEKQALIQHAKEHSANNEVMERLDKIEDRVYDNIDDVTKQVGKAA
ncbi:MAG: DUF2795 domain-containing protein [Deltaproteobacteria bacterium]|nr:DUF2795 domain-containing protein [Deltaproteobacteria bacterium]